jgi:hypothetical protein
MTDLMTCLFCSLKRQCEDQNKNPAGALGFSGSVVAAGKKFRGKYLVSFSEKTIEDTKDPWLGDAEKTAERKLEPRELQ